jgi:hypothetical protein
MSVKKKPIKPQKTALRWGFFAWFLGVSLGGFFIANPGEVRKIESMVPVIDLHNRYRYRLVLVIKKN